MILLMSSNLDWYSVPAARDVLRPAVEGRAVFATRMKPARLGERLRGEVRSVGTSSYQKVMTTTKGRFSPKKFIGELAKMKLLLAGALGFGWLAAYTVSFVNAEAFRRLFDGLCALVEIGLVALVWLVAIVLLFAVVVGVVSAVTESQKDS